MYSFIVTQGTAVKTFTNVRHYIVPYIKKKKRTVNGFGEKIYIFFNQLFLAIICHQQH